MDPLNLKKLNGVKKVRKAAILLTALKDGRDRLILEDSPRTGELGQAIDKAFRTGKSGILEIDGDEYFLNVHIPATKIIVIGAVHISQALAKIAKISGYDLQVIDPRTAFATDERFKGTNLFAEWPEDILNAFELDRFSALVAVTHDPKIDDYPIMQALKAGCFYVGALGSRKTHARRVARFIDAGLDQTAIDRIKAPIGLDIGAGNPQEIAVAIMAEIIAALRKRPISRVDEPLSGEA